MLQITIILFSDLCLHHVYKVISDAQGYTNIDLLTCKGSNDF